MRGGGARCAAVCSPRSATPERPEVIPVRALVLRAALLVALIAPAAHAAASGTQPWTLDDILGVRVVTDPQVSPDGRWIVWVVQELKPDSSDYQTDLWIAPATGG